MGEYICHFGTKNMKWGLRKYQYPDGSLTPAGRVRYLGDGSSPRLRLEAPKDADGYIDTEGYTVGYRDHQKSKGKYRATKRDESKDNPMDAEYENIPGKSKQKRKAKKNGSDHERDKQPNKPDPNGDYDYSEVDSKTQKSGSTKPEKYSYNDKTDNKNLRLDAAKSLSGTLSKVQEAYSKKTEADRKKKIPMDLSGFSNKELQDAIIRYNLENQYNERFAPSAVTKGEERVDAFLKIANNAATTGVAVWELMDKISAIDSANRKRK